MTTERLVFACKRAVRVILGGGDFGADRLLPDLFRAASTGKTLYLRNPSAIRPWQHVLSPLSGYLLLAQELFQSADYARAWNFGPHPSDALTVEEVIRRICELLPPGVSFEADPAPHPPEAPHLMLDSSLAREQLGWAPVMGLEQGLSATVEWFRGRDAGEDLRELTLRQVGKLG